MHVRTEKQKENLIVQTAFLGDLLLGIPLFKETRRLFPEHRLVVLCRKGLGSFLIRAGLADEVVEVDKSSKRSWTDAVDRLRSTEFEHILCPHESFRSAWLVRSLKAKSKIAYPRFFNGLIFDHRIPRPMELPETLRQLALLQVFDPQWQERLSSFASQQVRAGGQSSDGLMPVPDWADMRVEKLLSLRQAFREGRSLDGLASDKTQSLIETWALGERSRKLAILAPGSVWPTKMWTSDGYTQVAQQLVNQGWRVLFLGSREERELCLRIAQQVPDAFSLAGETSLYESAEILACADLLICNDSGAMHMAAAAGVPTVSVFGPTILEFGYRPWNNSARVVQVPLSCRPCGRHGAKMCPINTHDCMKMVTTEQVLKTTRDLI